MPRQVELLIIGAGPFGLAMAANARHLGLDYLVVGRPMDFWKSNMPQGMFLRSGYDWHLAPLNTYTMDRYLQEMGFGENRDKPIPVGLYLEYTEWFQKQIQLVVHSSLARRLDYLEDGDVRFQAELDSGEIVTSRFVLLAVGFRYFKYIPEELRMILPSGSFSHTCDLVNFDHLVGKRCLIIGGRQSAFEWAALLHEHGADTVHLSYRHDTPLFTESDWSWVAGIVDGMVNNPSWYRDLGPAGKEEVNRRLWAEGRLKLEPWLKPRIETQSIYTWPGTRVYACHQSTKGTIEAVLDSGEKLHVDHLILATGYRVNMAQVPFLAAGNILPSLAQRNGFPVLDKNLQSSLPGLYITSLPATQDFGPFFGFTVSVRASAAIIGSSIKSQRL